MCNRSDAEYAPIQPFFGIMQKMDSIYEEYARKNNLTYISMYILETLYDRKKCTQKEISEVTLYPKQTVNMVIRSFLNKGWIFFEQAGADKRSKYVKLTDEGEMLCERIFEPFWAAANNAFEELNDNNRDIMIKEMSVFTNSFIEKVKKI